MQDQSPSTGHNPTAMGRHPIDDALEPRVHPWRYGLVFAITLGIALGAVEAMTSGVLAGVITFVAVSAAIAPLMAWFGRRMPDRRGRS